MAETAEKYAYVRYRLDDTTGRVPISFIKNFDPNVKLDTAQLFKVFWSDISGDSPANLAKRIGGSIPIIETKGYVNYGEPD